MLSLQKFLPSQPKTSVSTVWRDSCRVSCHSCIFRTFLIFTHPGEHWQICSMSKSKYALKTTNIIYAVWLGIYAVSVSHFFGGSFQGGNRSYLRSSCCESLRHTCGIDRIPFHSKHHTLLEPSKMQKLSSHQKNSVWGLNPIKVNSSPTINNYCCPRLF